MGRPKKERAPLPPIWRPSDEQWAMVEPVLEEHDPPAEKGPDRVDQRAVLDAVIFRLRTGCQWNRASQMGHRADPRLALQVPRPAHPLREEGRQPPRPPQARLLPPLVATLPAPHRFDVVSKTLVSDETRAQALGFVSSATSRIHGVDVADVLVESALRPVVLWRKGNVRSDNQAGNLFAERLLKVVASCRQQRRKLLNFLLAAGEAAVQGTAAPSLPPAP